MEFVKKRCWQLQDVSCVCNNKALFLGAQNPQFSIINTKPKLRQ